MSRAVFNCVMWSRRRGRRCRLSRCWNMSAILSAARSFIAWLSVISLGWTRRCLAANIDDPDLLAWWRAYLNFELSAQLEGRRYPEYTLSAHLGGVVLVATFDLLVCSGERVVIFDWKTYSQRPSVSGLKSRLQTRVYPYVWLVGSSGGIAPEQVLMVYWVAGVSGEPVIFEYDLARFERDRAYLEGLVADMVRRLESSEDVWSLTADVTRCRFCEYRSLCGRGGAGR